MEKIDKKSMKTKKSKKNVIPEEEKKEAKDKDKEITPEEELNIPLSMSTGIDF
jgi:hypothetical protein